MSAVRIANHFRNGFFSWSQNLVVELRNTIAAVTQTSQTQSAVRTFYFQFNLIHVFNWIIKSFQSNRDGRRYPRITYFLLFECVFANARSRAPNRCGLCECVFVGSILVWRASRIVCTPHVWAAILQCLTLHVAANALYSLNFRWTQHCFANELFPTN